MTQIRSEIPASVWQVKVAEGDQVADGDELIILESMKMEIPVVAPVGGTVERAPREARRPGPGGRRARRAGVTMSWKPELEELAHRRELMQGMGGQEGIDRQHGRGKLTVRERLPLLADPGTFQEFGHLRGSGDLRRARRAGVVHPAGQGRRDVPHRRAQGRRHGRRLHRARRLGQRARRRPRRGAQRVAAGARVAAAVRPAARCRRWQRAQLRGDRPHVPARTPTASPTSTCRC